MSGNNFGRRNIRKDNRGSPAVFLDRDGTLIEDIGYLSDHNKVFLLPDVIPALKLLMRHGFKLILTTNQSGIERKFLTLDQLKKIHDRLTGVFTLNDVRLDGIYFCPHHPNRNCLCRKPQTKMAYLAKSKLNLDLKKSFSVGDKISDVEFGRGFGGKGILVLTGYGKKQARNPKPDYVAKDILDASQWIVRNYKSES